jgi:hypothetical protein
MWNERSTWNKQKKFLKRFSKNTVINAGYDTFRPLELL